MGESEKDATISLLDGHYKITGAYFNLMQVKGDKAVTKGVIDGIEIHLEFKDFGPADSVIAERTGKSNNNFQLSLEYGMKLQECGVIRDDGLLFTMKGITGVYFGEKVSDEGAKKIETDGDPIDAPPCPYKIQPENQGKFLWITGPQGTGKSTSAAMLGQHAGYVFYEGDCFGALRNPYIPVDVEEPSIAQIMQRPLIGEGLEERKKIIGKSEEVFFEISKGNAKYEDLKEYYGIMCEDIDRERKRIGGDWVVACIAPERGLRDFCRSILGPDLIFVVLELDPEANVQRCGKGIKRTKPLKL